MRQPSSGSTHFDQLRDALQRDRNLRKELEYALDLNVRQVNPTDRANRFGSGAAVEWILAAAAFSAGVLTLPGGHNLNGFDLLDLREVARGLWSVKNQTKRSDFRITNGLGGGGAGFVDPTVFVSPALPGLTFVDPSLHTDVARQVVRKPDAVILPFRALLAHTEARPECVAPCEMPVNPGTGTSDPWKDYIEGLLGPSLFPRLSALFVEAKPVSRTLNDSIADLVRRRDAGEITREQFDAALTKLTA